MAEHDAPADWQNPWVWTLTALVVGVVFFAFFAPPAAERGPTEFALGAGRTGAATGVAAGTTVPEAWKGR